jgi:hypothetical protein
MATITPQAVLDTGTVVTFAAATGGGDVVTLAQGSTTTLVVNTVGTGCTVTLATPNNDPYGNAVADKAVVISTNKTVHILMPYAEFADVNGQCAVTWSAVTSVTVGATRQ